MFPTCFQCFKKQKIYYLFIVLILSCGFFLSCTTANRSKNPEIEKGILNLEEWNFAQQGPVSLSGEWNFYWKQFITPNNFSKVSDVDQIQFPGSWKGEQWKGESLPGQGHGTYSLEITVKNQTTPLTLRVPTIRSAYRLYIDGELIHSCGTPGINQQESKPGWKPALIRFTPKGKKARLLLQVSNFHHKRGGTWEKILLGEEQQIQSLREKKVFWDLLGFTALLTMGMYHLLRFLFRRNDWPLLWFALTCLLISIRIAVTSERYLNQLFPSLSWETSLKLIYLTFYASIPIFTMFLHALFGKTFSPIPLRIIQVVGGVFTAIVLLTPSSWYTHTFITYELITLLIACYLLYLLIKATWEKQEGALLFLIGFIFLFIAGINDILFSQEFIQTGNLLPLGTIAILLVQSFQLAWRSSQATIRIEKLNHQLKELDTLKDEFLANTSHELRTPLQGIIGIAESLKKRIKEDLSQFGNDLELIVHSGKRLTVLVNDLLDLSRLKNKELRLEVKPLNLFSLTERTLFSCRTLLQEKNLTAENKIPENTSSVLADESRIEQVLLNLITNAIKFTNSGKIQITAKVKEEMVEVLVTDTGIGIPKEKQMQIFEAFEQIKPTNWKSQGGTGLGLNISKNLITLHGGTLTVESEEGEGSTFSFTLPTIEKEQKTSNNQLQPKVPIIEPIPITIEQLRSQAASSLLENSPSLQKTILLVDDELINLQVLISQLQRTPYRILLAENGREALKIVKETVPDLILLDIVMPEIDGLQVATKIRREYNKSLLPIIILSAKGQEEDIVEGLKHGANDYLTKPFSQEILLARVKSQLESKESVERMKEVRLLKKEIFFREEAERELRQQQKKQKELLNLTEEAILSIDELGVITYCNDSAAKLFEKSKKELLGQLVTHFFPEFETQVATISEIVEWSEEKFDQANQEEIFLNFSFLPKPTSCPILLKQLNVDTDEFSIFFNPKETILEIQNQGESPKKQQPGQNKNFRRLLVESMILSMELWTKKTGKSRYDFAEESETIWDCTQDEDGTLRTKTLDKYLDINKLPPVRPKFKKVIETAEYIIEHCSLSCDERKELSSRIEAILSFVRNG